jgi:hypothetical protein
MSNPNIISEPLNEYEYYRALQIAEGKIEDQKWEIKRLKKYADALHEDKINTLLWVLKMREALGNLDAAANFSTEYGDGLLSASFVKEAVKVVLSSEKPE